MIDGRNIMRGLLRRFAQKLRAEIAAAEEQNRRADRIADIPSIRKTAQATEAIAFASKWLPRTKPLLRILRVDVAELQNAVTKAQELIPTVRSVTESPDRFNDLFASRGWIVYDGLGHDVILRAINAAEDEGMDEAEQLLVEFYGEETLKLQMRRLATIQAFKPRLELARKAMDDYLAGRYHASVPVVLSLLDGFVNDLSPTGFFARGADLTAWDSMAAHSKGLQKLQQILTKRRGKTTTEQLTLPYRHGVIHGRDLGYDNKLVAAKSWAALFATGDWARKMERGEKHPPPPAPPVTLRGLVESARRISHDKRKLEEWQPRVLVVGQNLPANGSPDEYEEGTPERLLAQFLMYWSRGNYGKMAERIPLPRSGSPLSKMAGLVRETYAGYSLEAFQLRRLEDKTPMTTDVSAWCRVNAQDREHVFRLTCQNATGELIYRWRAEGRWVLTNWRALLSELQSRSDTEP